MDVKTRGSRMLEKVVALAMGVLLCLCFFGVAVADPPIRAAVWVGMGDSLGEGVQSMNAFWASQIQGYLPWVARQARVSFPLPYIRSGPWGVVNQINGRSRLNPRVEGLNLAVSGATVHDLLYDEAQAESPAEFRSETDLVLYPRKGSQMDIAEQISPDLIVCWIGNNDVLSAVDHFDHLDASQMTPVDEFQRDYEELMNRLEATGAQVVVANIPDVASIGFLLDNENLGRFIGPGSYLPEGSYTTIAAMFMYKLGMADETIFQDPEYVLDADEIASIRARTAAFNRIIQNLAQDHDFAFVDTAALFKETIDQPPVFAGVAVKPVYLGGLFSLDGVHLSNIGYALVANAFIEALNDRYDLEIPEISQTQLTSILLKDPFVDKDGDGKVRGRPYTGALETLAVALGLSGDKDDHVSPHPGPLPPVPADIEAFRSSVRSLWPTWKLPQGHWDLGVGRSIFRRIF